MFLLFLQTVSLQGSLMTAAWSCFGLFALMIALPIIRKVSIFDNWLPVSLRGGKATENPRYDLAGVFFLGFLALTFMSNGMVNNGSIESSDWLGSWRIRMEWSNSNFGFDDITASPLSFAFTENSNGRLKATLKEGTHDITVDNIELSNGNMYAIGTTTDKYHQKYEFFMSPDKQFLTGRFLQGGTKWKLLGGKKNE